MADIYRKIGFDVSSAIASIDKLNNAINGLSANMAKVPQGPKGGGGGLGAALGLGSLGAVATAAKQIGSYMLDAASKAAEFGIKIEQIQTIGSELAKSNQELSRSVLDISSAYGIAAGDVAEGVYQILSNQVVEAGEAFGFMEEAAKLATVGVGTTSDAIDTMSSVMNAYSLGAGDMQRVSDTLFRSIDLGRFQLKDLSDTLGRVTPIAAQAGVSWEEVATSLAVMTQQGVRADTAITQLRAILTKIIKPTAELQKLYEKWGVKDGPTAIATFGGLRGVLAKLQQDTKGSTAELGELFNEVRGLAGALALNVDGGRKFNEVLGEITNSSGDVEKAFDKFINSDAKAYQKAVESLKNAWIEFGQAVLQVGSKFAIVLEVALSGSAGLLTFLKNLTAEALGFSTAFEKAAVKTKEAALQKRLDDIAKEPSKGAFDQVGVDASLQKFNQTMVERLKSYQQAARGVQKVQDDMLRSFSAYTQSVMSKFTEAINQVESRLKALPNLIQKASSDIKTADVAIQDEQLRQKLSKADGNSAQQARILREDADKKYWEARKALQNKNLNEETAAEAKAVLDRAIEAQRAVETAAKGAGDKRGESDAQSRILQLLKEQKGIAEQTQKNLLNEQNLLNGAIDRMKQMELEVNNLIKERIKLAKDYRKALGSGDREAADAIGESIDTNSQKLVDVGKGMSDDMKEAFDKTLGEGSALDISKTLRQRLPQAGTDLQNWITEQQDKLSAMQARIQVTPELNLSQVMAELRKQGFQTDDQDPLGTLTRAQTQGKADEKAFQEARKQRDLAQAEVKGQSLIAAEQIVGLEEQLKLMGGTIPETADALKQVTDIIANMKQGIAIDPTIFEAARSALAAAKAESINGQDDTVEKAQLVLEMMDKLEQAKQKLRDSRTAVDQAGEKALGGRFIIDLAEKSTQIKTNMYDTANAMQGWTDPVTRLNQLLDESNTKASTVQQSTANIGTSGNQAALGVGSISTALDVVIQKAVAAAQAVASIGSGAGAAAPPQHFGGRYFARGGLGMLAPRGTDTIPAMIQRGEFVVNKKSAGKYFSQLTAMNNGLQPLYRREGGSVTNVGDVNVTVQGGDTSRQTVRAIARELRHELKRGTIRFN